MTRLQGSWRCIPRRGWMAALAAAGVVATAGAGCETRPVSSTGPSHGPWLELGQPYAQQRIPPGGQASYRFRTTARGAYLITLSDVASPTTVTLTHPKRTCYLVGNGACELVSSPDEAYGFQVKETGGKPLQYTVMVQHIYRAQTFEGVAAQPIAVRVGTPRPGTLGPGDSSYYHFRTGPERDYAISVRGVRSDVGWKLFDRWVFDVILATCDAHRGARDERCRLPALQPQTDYYMLVSEQSGVPGTFMLDIEPLVAKQ